MMELSMRQTLLRVSLFAFVMLGVAAPRAAFAEAGVDVQNAPETSVPFAPDMGVDRMPDTGNPEGGSGAPIFDAGPRDTSADPLPDAGIADIGAPPDVQPADTSTLPDTAVSTDAPPATDSGAAADATADVAADAPNTMASGGCSVATPGGSGAGGAFALASLGFAAVIARRLRRARR